MGSSDEKNDNEKIVQKQAQHATASRTATGICCGTQVGESCESCSGGDMNDFFCRKIRHLAQFLNSASPGEDAVPRRSSVGTAQ
jgi:hypothetical protein